MFKWWERRKANKQLNTEKEIATKNGEPWVTVVSVHIDQDEVGDGSFELDWNEYFIAKLIRAGYQGKDDATMVDQWFQDVCRNILMETYEQEQAQK